MSGVFPISYAPSVDFLGGSSTLGAMDAAITPTERNRAHARVGVGAGAAFLALLLVLLVTHGPAAADPGVPATAPAPPVAHQLTPPDPGFRPRREGG
jgi:hypothetical protein